jgi:subtilisin family serine protease
VHPVSRPRLRLASLLLIVFAVSSFGVPLPLAGSQGKVRLIVAFAPGAGAALADASAEASGGRIVSRIPELGVRVVELPSAAVSRARATWAADSLVTGVEEDGLVQVDWMPSDPLWGYQWEQRQVRMPRAWNITRGSGTTVVAVVDTGVQASHPDLVGQLVPGRDVLNNDRKPSDDNGHGTAVAGVIAATAANGIGVAGGCMKCRVMPIKALDADGTGYWSVAAQGIIWAANHGADVINLSFGGPTGGSTLHDAIAYARSKGALVIASAGNNNSASAFYPGAYDNVLGVAASNEMDLRYSWSNYSTSWVDLAAPGCTYTTIKTSAYHSFCGTSAAAPLLSSVAALVRARRPGWTDTRVEALLRDSAVATPYQFTRRGRIDAYAAVYRAKYGYAPAETYLKPSAPFLPVGTRLVFASGDHVGYRFDKNGGVVRSRRISLSSTSGADTTKRQTIPYRSGRWFWVSNGGLAGYWVLESARVYLKPAATPTPTPSATPTATPTPTAEPGVAERLPSSPRLDPTLKVTFRAGTHTGYRFDTHGGVLDTRNLGLDWNSGANAAKVGRIAEVGGTWFYIVNGGLAAYWVRSSTEVYLQTDPLPRASSSTVLSPPAPEFGPPQRVRLVAGRHVGYRFATDGTVLGRTVLDRATATATNATKRMHVPGRTGWWLYVVDGRLAGHWVKESSRRYLRP